MTRHELYQSFQHEFPISTLKNMDIEKLRLYLKLASRRLSRIVRKTEKLIELPSTRVVHWLYKRSCLQ